MEVQKFELPSGSDIRIVGEQEAQNMKGWRLVAIVVAAQPMQCMETIGGPVYSSNQVWRESSCVRYVLARDPHEVIDALRSEANGLRTAASEAREKAKEMAEQLKRTDLESAELKKDLAGSRAVLKVADATYEKTNVLKRKLENDIGKIRAAIGEIRMKEILGA